MTYSGEEAPINNIGNVVILQHQRDHELCHRQIKIVSDRLSGTAHSRASRHS